MEQAGSILPGGCLPVPSVRELAKQPLTSVPARYIRDDQEPLLSNGTALLPEVPIIDMKKLLLTGESDSPELRKLHYACKDWGFFLVINHGVNSMLVEKVKTEIENLFELSPEDKKKLQQRDGDLQGFGQLFVVSEEQKLDWGDMFYMVTYPPHLRKPYLFPQLPQSFRETMEEYCEMMRKLAMEILCSIAKTLKMDEKEMRDLFEEGKQAIRANYYPPCPQPELVMGLTPHSDAAGLTILLQVNEMEGLQIKKDGMWVPVKPLPGAFVVNVGDVLEMVTNGIYRSIEHRAAVNSTKERLSIGTFLWPKFDGDMGPAPSLITPQTPAVFRRTTVVDYIKGFFSKELEGKSYLDVFRVSKDPPSL